MRSFLFANSEIFEKENYKRFLVYKWWDQNGNRVIHVHVNTWRLFYPFRFYNFFSPLLNTEWKARISMASWDLLPHQLIFMNLMLNSGKIAFFFTIKYPRELLCLVQFWNFRGQPDFNYFLHINFQSGSDKWFWIYSTNKPMVISTYFWEFRY